MVARIRLFNGSFFNSFDHQVLWVDFPAHFGVVNQELNGLLIPLDFDILLGILICSSIVLLVVKFHRRRI